MWLCVTVLLVFMANSCPAVKCFLADASCTVSTGKCAGACRLGRHETDGLSLAGCVFALHRILDNSPSNVGNVLLVQHISSAIVIGVLTTALALHSGSSVAIGLLVGNLLVQHLFLKSGRSAVCTFAAVLG